MKRKIICFLSVIFMIVFCISLSACDDDDLSNGTADDYFKNVNMPLVYEIYLDYVEEIGETPLTYEEWFEVVHGDEFQKGILPEIRKNDLTDFWEISYNNGKGWNDLRFKTETEEQKNCKHSFDKWIILCEGNDYCNGIRYRNCKNCNYKDYQFKLNDNVCLHLELETIAGTPATCVSEGLTDGQKCVKCGEVVVEQQIIPATDDHRFINGVCDICGEIGETKYSEGLAYTVIGTEACYISGIGRCTDHDIKIPEYIDGYKVTSIGNSAFHGCSSLTSIVIPEGVTSIGDRAFAWCDNLTSIVILDGVTSIGYSAFWGCSSLTNIKMPNSVTSIGERAFLKCSSLANVVIGNGVTSIGNDAFRDCIGLTSIVIPDSVTSVGDRVFLRCNSLTSITVEKGNTVYHSAGNCLIETASKTLIEGCKNSVIPTDGSVTSIGDEAFYYGSSLTSIVIPDSVTRIGYRAFSDCSSLTSVVIGNSVTSIGDYAFYKCSSLTRIVIPDSVTSIGSSAFEACNNLTSIVIPDSVTSICEETFSSCDCLTNVAIGNGVTSIGNDAFRCCSSLTNIVIPDSVTSIGERAFQYCSNLTSIVIPNSVTSIDEGAFCHCSNLTCIVIPDSVTSIGGAALLGCNSLESITVEQGNTIYHSAGNCLIETASKTLIAGCENSVIPTDGSVTSIGSCAFDSRINLTSIVIPDSVTSIGYSAFYYCINLTSIEFRGTRAQWDAISKGSDWNYDTGNYTVHCTDGDIAKYNS